MEDPKQEEGGKEPTPSPNLIEPAGWIERALHLVEGTDSFQEAFARLVLVVGGTATVVAGLIFWGAREQIVNGIVEKLQHDHYRAVLTAEKVRSTHIPPELESYRYTYGADQVVVWSFHNGTISLRKSAIYATDGSRLALDRLENLAATLDDQVLLKFYRKECIETKLDGVSPGVWSQSSLRLLKEQGTYYNWACPLIANQELIGYVSVSWTEAEYAKIKDIPAIELEESLKILTIKIGSAF